VNVNRGGRRFPVANAIDGDVATDWADLKGVGQSLVVTPSYDTAAGLQQLLRRRRPPRQCILPTMRFAGASGLGLGSTTGADAGSTTSTSTSAASSSSTSAASSSSSSSSSSAGGAAVDPLGLLDVSPFGTVSARGGDRGQHSHSHRVVGYGGNTQAVSYQRGNAFDGITGAMQNSWRSVLVAPTQDNQDGVIPVQPGPESWLPLFSAQL
jgi:hypothetical protein